MAIERIEISPNSEAFWVFRNGGRDTWYKLNGQVFVSIDEATVMHKIEAVADSELKGFTPVQPFSSNPYTGIDTPVVQPTPSNPVPQPPQPSNSGWVQLHTLPCIDNYADVFLCDESIKDKPNDNYVEWQLLMYSLTYVEWLINEGKLSTCNYVIKDDTGKEWVRVFQKKGAKAEQFQGDCGNNHPMKVYLPQLIDDCCVYLPKDRNYWVEMTNTGQIPIQAWVHHPTGINRDIYKSKLDAGQTVSIYVSKGEFNGQPWDNTMKVNGNCNYDVVPSK